MAYISTIHPLYIFRMDAVLGSILHILRMKKQPDIYQIKVAGVLDPDWSDRLGSLDIKVCTGDVFCGPVTQLEGYVRDQAQLSGILNTLSDLRYKLLSVTIIEH